jgi:hypothetical protein
MSETPHDTPDATRHKRLNILSVNINRSNPKLISLLESTTADCVLVQEPWWGTLIPRRSDTDPEGDPSYGTVSHPAWTAFVPGLSSSPDHQPRVITFVRKQILRSCPVTPIGDLSFYDLLGLSFRSHGFTLTIINFYHHVQRHQGNVSHLIESSFDASQGRFQYSLGYLEPGRETNLPMGCVPGSLVR